MKKYALVYRTHYDCSSGGKWGIVVGTYESIEVAYMVKSTFVALADKEYWERLQVEEIGGNKNVK